MQKWLRALLIPLLCFTFYNVLLFIEGLSSDILRGSPLQAYIWSLLLCTKPPATTTRICCVSHGSQQRSLILKTGIKTWIRGRKAYRVIQAGNSSTCRQILPAKEPIFSAKEDKTGGESFRASIIEVRNTSKTSSELLYFQLESFCLVVWAHHFHIYGNFSRKIRI